MIYGRFAAFFPCCFETEHGLSKGQAAKGAGGKGRKPQNAPEADGAKAAKGAGGKGAKAAKCAGGAREHSPGQAGPPGPHSPGWASHQNASSGRAAEETATIPRFTNALHCIARNILHEKSPNFLIKIRAKATIQIFRRAVMIMSRQLGIYFTGKAVANILQLAIRFDRKDNFANVIQFGAGLRCVFWQ